MDWTGMTPLRSSLLGLTAAAGIAACALPALAQSAAATPAAQSAASTPAQDKAARDLAQAAFAHPKPPPAPPETPAAQIAAESAKAKAAAPPEPRPEWVSKEGVSVGGKGVQYKAPF